MRPIRVQQPPSPAAAHEHVFQNGKCDCGRYEANFLTRIPIKNELTAAIKQAGSVEELTYTTHAYAIEEAFGASDVMIEKKLLIYLPYGYNAAEKYDILYLMHGGGESECYWLADTPPAEGVSAMGKTTRAVLDNLMQSGNAKQTIVVAPTFYASAEGYEDSTVENTAWIDFQGSSHAYNCWIVDLYNCMLVFFQQ